MTYFSRKRTAPSAIVATIIAAGALMAGSATLVQAGHHTPIEQAVQSKDRPAADVERDAGRKPAEVLAFYGVEPGMTIVDLYSGGGYYANIVAKVVGEEGKVIAHQSPRAKAERRAALMEQYAGTPNVELVFANPEDLEMVDASADGVLLFLLYHHWHYTADSGENTPDGTKAKIANVYRMLKPGGFFGVIEHRAADDATREASNALHRIPASAAIDDITAAGFVYGGESLILDDHPEDDIAKYWRGNTPRGQTRRLVHLYRKPAN